MEVEKEKLKDALCKYYDDIGDLIKYSGVDEHSVDDVLNDVFEDACRAINRGKKPDSLEAWLRKIARNKVKAYFKKNYKERDKMANMELGNLSSIEEIEDEVTVEKILLEAEEKKILKDLLDTLPENTRTIVIMRDWGKHTFPEIADILGINLNTVKSLHRRSRPLLQKNYHEMFGEEAYYD